MECRAQRVLVVEDERHIARLIQVNLERQGHTVFFAYTGAQALAALATEQFDLMVVDSRLPDMSGRELIRRVRENPDTSNIRVILLGSIEDRDDNDDRPGPNLFMTKPFNPMHLVWRPPGPDESA